MSYLSFSSPLGILTVFAEGEALVSIDWGRAPETGAAQTPLLAEARAQLEAYFDGRLQVFDLPLAPAGTAFQKKVWKALQAIPYGLTLTYGELARKVKSAPRPVGGACGRNPIPIVIPCHRVLGADGALTGYSGGEGPATKEALLRLEGALP